ncbi:hypothetical protein K438DRAFT_1832166 [Mycena galopus ATCC 62051]|nr:hypothetical protein K438DRAFT_1832166 [Mycena galopus ATCC 62051]
MALVSLLLFLGLATAYSTTTEAQNATVNALVYGIPLHVFAQTFSSTNWTANVLAHSTSLSNASTREVVLPNIDTLYSLAVLDLSAGDVVATMPTRETGRFYVWPFYDLYSNNFCNLGTIANSTAGKYLIQYRASNPGCEPGKGQYAGIIYSPTVFGATLLRIEAGNATDVAHVVSSIQPLFSLTHVPTTRPVCDTPPLTKALLTDGLNTTDAGLYIPQLLARFGASNPPEVATDVSRINNILRTAGISTSSKRYTTPAHVNLTQAYTAAQSVAAGVQDISSDFDTLGNGWGVLAPSLSGDFHAHYDVRAFIAIAGYFQLQSSQAVYPSYSSPLGTLSSNQTYLLQFFGKPQVDGFWSLTVYDASGFLVPNPINRYGLNDRSNMTYPDGSLVYGGSSPGNSSAPFYMLLQSTDILPDAVWADK